MTTTTLYLCEKPSQARDIARVLGASTRKDGYLEKDSVRVTWCIGHLLEMANPDDYDPRFKRWSFETLPILPEQWQMKVTPKLVKQFKVIQRLLKQASEVIIATDADREGETIAREILELCGYRGAIRRLWLSALDEKSIRKALGQLLPNEQTRPLYAAGLGRARADWLIGMNLTRAYTLLSKQRGNDQVVSVGRVQTPTLNLVVRRDLEIEQFKPVPYFDLVVDCDAGGALYRAKWLPERSDSVAVDLEGRCRDAAVAERVAREVEQQVGSITQFDTSIKSESPPLPFDLSSLQIEASRRFGLDANAVLKAAQALYETHKATTYPRTDCRYLPVSQHDEVEAILEAVRKSDPDWAAHSPVGQADPVVRSRCWNDKKITAHHAIIPTSAPFDLQALSQAELQVYTLIRLNYVAQFFPAYRYEAITAETTVAGHVFRSRGRKTLNPGWRVLTANADAQDEDQQDLPAALHEGMNSRIIRTECLHKETKPPARFTSGSLIAAMKNAAKTVNDPELRKVLKETAGIGTEATRASIIDTLLDRGYLKKSGKHLISTEFGRELIAAVPDVLKDPATTALWEQVLDDIAQGNGSLTQFMDKQKAFIEQMIRYLEQQQAAMPQAPEYPCPACGKPMRLVKRMKPKKLVFWGCSAFPECKHTQPDDGGKPGQFEKKNATRKQLVVGQKCPQCSTGNLVQKTVKNGKNAGKAFVGCSNYPKCNAFSWADPA